MRVTALFLVAFCAIPVRASAERRAPIAVVRQHDQRARQSFEEGDYQRALEELREAQQILPAPERLFSMAACQQRLEHPQEAVALYERYLDDPEADEEQSALARQRIEELRAEPAVEAGEAVDEPGSVTTFGDEDQDHPVASTSGRRRLGRAPFFAMLGITGAAALGVVVLGAVTLSRHEEFLATDPGPVYDDLQNSGQAMAVATNVFLGLACVSAAVAVVLAIFTDWRRRSGGATSHLQRLGLWSIAPTL